ncbi:protein SPOROCYTELESS [Mangifera indica]|uniref:protein SPOROCYTELESS n=1 Tax=Mangifera indica TaxID=29780 RepID=UPI001CFA7A3C|nr:protein SPOROCYTELESS [Mangifera indica]
MESFNNAMQEPSLVCIASDREGEAKGEATKSCRGRKVGSKTGASQKKKPQRGMGVAQLERLRMQEITWRKMGEMPPLEAHHLHHHQHYYSPHLALMKPIPSIPVLHGATSYAASVLGGVGGGSLLGLDQTALMIQSTGNDGGSGHHNPDVTPSLGFVETSNEHSSIQKIQPQWALASERCDICSKKKRFHGQNTGFNGINTADIHGLNQQNNINFNEGLSDFGARAARSAFYASHDLNHHQGVEVKTIHRNGNSRGGNVLMEYDFFPGKDGKSTSSNEMEFMPTEASVAVVGDEASFLTSTVYGVNESSNSVDLSLKLSY